MAANADTSSLSRALHHVIVVLIVLPLIYFLSVAPAMVIVVKVPKLREPVRAVYAPVIWLHDHKFLTRQMDLYLGFWQRTARQM